MSRAREPGAAGSANVAPERDGAPDGGNAAGGGAAGGSGVATVGVATEGVDAPRTRVAFQGDHGAFSEQAAVAMFPDSPPVTLPVRDFAAVGAAVRDGLADYGVLPVENSIHGSVTAAYDVLGAGGLTVVGERVRPIDLCLLGTRGTTLGAVRRVISHPVALAQCGRFLEGLGNAHAEAWYDTAGAARAVATAGDPSLAAVAGNHAGEVYGLDVLAGAIQDRPDNATRFFLVTRPGAANSAAFDGPHRAVLVLEADHRPGALVRVLQPFAERGVNLTRIESRPASEPWRYQFFIELSSETGAAAVFDAVEAVRLQARRLDLIGCFPA